MSAKKSDVFEEIYQKLTHWFDDVKQHEMTNMVEFIEQAKNYAKAAEALPEERVGQFIDNLKLDLKEFHQQWQKDSEHSVYLGLMNEAWWQALADMTDKSQVEWAELAEDFEHEGLYKAGDFIGFGELECTKCQNHLHITHFSELAECAKCGHTEFKRFGMKP